MGILFPKDELHLLCICLVLLLCAYVMPGEEELKLLRFSGDLAEEEKEDRGLREAWIAGQQSLGAEVTDLVAVMTMIK